MLAADAELDIRPPFPAPFDGYLDQLSYAIDIEGDKWVLLDDPALLVSSEEIRGIVPGQTIGGLRKVVGTKTEELCDLGNLRGT